MKYLFLLILNLIINVSINSQNDSITKFFYKNGSLASEGILHNGKPDGYWKTYYDNGNLKSEGNRKNYELDSLWIFYDKVGVINKTIYYKNGLKNGSEEFYKKGYKYEVVPYKNGIREGKYLKFYRDGRVLYESNYLNNELIGKGYEFDTTDNIITVDVYKNGVLSKTQHINRYNSNNEKYGLWLWFNSEKSKTLQGTYKNGLKHGYFKYYGNKNNLLKTEKYINGEIQEDAIEVSKLEIKRNYFDDKKLKSYKSFRNSIPDGVHKEFNEKGEIISTVLYQLGIIISKGGTIDTEGKKQGYWTDFFITGEKKSNGEYIDGKKSGKWNYFYKSGKLEQVGNYKNNKATGEWIWSYENGNILRKEFFIDGKENGIFIEYNINNEEIVKGNYIHGKKSGKWFYISDLYKNEGMYEYGLKSGKWQYIFIENTKIVSETTYYEGAKDGIVKYYYNNGVLKIEGKYESNLKQGNWKYYNERGVKVLTVEYSNGIDLKYNNVSTTIL